jgi:hypothetical protein
MQIKHTFIIAAASATMLVACQNKTQEMTKTDAAFEVEADRFADLQVLRYQVEGFDSLSPKQKELAYYLYEAALSGRDIIYDQKYKQFTEPIKVTKIRKIIKNLWYGLSVSGSVTVFITIIQVLKWPLIFLSIILKS